LHFLKKFNASSTSTFDVESTPFQRTCAHWVLAADSAQVSALCLLDLTAAFDTVEHDLHLLLLRLERQCGLRGVVLRWFQSNLSGRSFQVSNFGENSL